MNGTQSDTDLLLRIRDRAGADEAYPMEALLSDASFFRGRLLLDQIELKATDNDHDARAYGWHLYERLFTGWISHAYDLARGIARERSEGRLRVHLWIDGEEPLLHALKWEWLYHYHNEQLLPISASGTTAFSRYIGLGVGEPQAIARRPIEMLVAVSNPGDLIAEIQGLTPVAVNEEISSLLSALGTLPRQRQIRLTFLLGHEGEEQLTTPVREKLSALDCSVIAAATSLDRIGLRLPAANIFHFIGHGQFSAQRETTALLLEDEDGGGDWVDDDALISSLASSERLLHLIFLASCEGARREETHPYVGLAAQLVRAGVPAVVAMQETITMPGAQQLAAEFYHRLLRHGSVDRALNAARGQLHNDRPGEEGDWSTPVLFMRLRTGCLFAPDPVQETMEAMAADPAFSFFDPESGHYLPLPVEVVAFQDPVQLRRLDRLDPETTAALDFLPAIEDLLERQREEPEQKPILVGVVGGFGSNKATQLQGLVWETLQAVATLALGDVAEQLWAGAAKRESQRALAFLGKRFGDAETSQAVCWALSDALAMMDVGAVAETVIMPYLADLEQRQGDPADWVNRDKSTAYLMGQIRAPGAEVLSFLTDHCISAADDMRLWLCAMDALSRLGGPEAQKVLADIATGCTDLQQTFAAPDERDALRRTAILMLVDMGDREAIAALRHSPAADEGTLLPPIYRATRAIYWQEQQ